MTLPSFSKSTSEEGMGAEAGSSCFFPLVAPGQLHPGEEVAAAGLQEISLGLVGWQGEGTVQGVEPEEVAMSGSSGWAGSVIAGSPEVVQALGSHPGHRALAGDTPREFADADGDSIEDPMDRDTHRAVGVGHGEGEPFGALGRSVQRSGGETSEPSQVYLAGISPLGPNAGLRSLKALTDTPDPKDPF